MARTGRFGSLPGKAPDLSATIVALLEQYESARDRNILNAWLNGGSFEGKKVTDSRIRNWFKSRRNEYSKDDPEYDYWDQQLKQVDYQIGESKMLLAYEQGKIKEGGAAAWYTQNAKRFPKNSEAWREAMRNAARFKKAAQESQRAASTISKSEQYDNAINRIVKNKIQPAEDAIAAWEEMLRDSGYKAEGGFLGMNPEQMAGDEELRRFLNTKKGRAVKRNWERATGRKFTFKTMRQLVQQGEDGYLEAAGVAQRFGFQSYVSGFKSSARNMGEYTTQFKAYNGDIYDRYLSLKEQYDTDIANADTPAERNAIRRKYAQQIDKLAGRATRIGDSELGGALRNESLAVQGKAPRANASGDLSEAGRFANGRTQMTADDLNYQEQVVGKGTPDERTLVTGVIDQQGLSSYEIEMQQAIRDQEAEKGLKDGTWMWMKGQDGSLTEIPVSNLQDFYGSSDFVAAGAKLNYKYNPDGTRETVLIQPEQLYIDFGNGPEAVAGYTTYENLSGQTRFVIANGVDGDPDDTATLPWEGLTEFDDGDPRSPSGTIGYTDDTGVYRYEPVVSVENGIARLGPRYMDAITRGFYIDALGLVEQPNGDWLDAEGNVFTGLTSEMRQSMVQGAIRQANFREDENGLMVPVSGFTPITVATPNKDYVAPLRERLGEMTVAEIKEELTPEQWEQFKAEVDRTVPGSNLPGKLLDFERNNFRVQDTDIRDLVVTNLYENPAVAVFGGSTDPAVQAAAVEGRAALAELPEAEVEAIVMRDNSSEQVLSLRQTVEDYGVDDPIGRDAQDRLDDMRAKAENIVRANVEQGVNPDGSPRIREEDDAFGYSGDVVPVEEIRAVQNFESGTDGEVGTPTVLTTFEVPEVYVIADTGNTSDESGLLAQFQSPLGREQLARMPVAARQELLADIVEKNGQTGNPDYTYAIANEIDALTSTGKHAGSEEEYNRYSGALADNERLRNIQAARRIANAGDGLSIAEPLEASIVSDLRSSGWTDEQIKDRFPEQYQDDVVRRSMDRDIMPVAAPMPGGAVPGGVAFVDPYSWEGPKTGTGQLDAALRTAQAAAQPQSQNVPQTPTPKPLPNLLDFKPVSTVKPTAPAAPAAFAPTAAPTAPTAAPSFDSSNFLPNPRFTAPGNYSWEGPPPPTNSTPPPSTPAYRQPSFKPPGIR